MRIFPILTSFRRPLILMFTMEVGSSGTRKSLIDLLNRPDEPVDSLHYLSEHADHNANIGQNRSELALQSTIGFRNWRNSSDLALQGGDRGAASVWYTSDNNTDQPESLPHVSATGDNAQAWDVQKSRAREMSHVTDVRDLWAGTWMAS